MSCPEDVIASLDARILALEQELAGLKYVRNGLTLLYRLPDELLLNIAGHLILKQKEVPRRDLFSICAVSRRLRHLFNSSPELWSHVDSSWKRGCLDHFLSSARDHPLHLVINMPWNNVSRHTGIISESMPRLTSVFGAVYHDMDGTSLWSELNTAAAASTLRSIELISSNKSATFIEGGLMTGVCPGLTSLALVKVVIVEVLPPFPLLQRLKLWSTKSNMHSLRNLLLHSPLLKGISLSAVLCERGSELDFAEILQFVRLPDLEDLEIKDELRNVADLLGMMPDPRVLFTVHITALEERFSWSSMHGLNGGIISRLKHFWQTASCAEFPEGYVISECLEVYAWPSIIFRSTRGDGGPSIDYRSFSTSIAEHDPLLPSVKTLYLSCRGRQSVGSMIPTDKIAIEFLPGVRTLIITSARWGTSSGLQRLEQWLLSQHDSGRALQLVQFMGCSKSYKPLFDRLVSGGVAEAVTWERHYTPSLATNWAESPAIYTSPYIPVSTDGEESDDVDRFENEDEEWRF
jgi:hypothetical protein